MPWGATSSKCRCIEPSLPASLQVRLNLDRSVTQPQLNSSNSTLIPHQRSFTGDRNFDRNAGGSPSMPTFQDSPKWTGTMGEARHADDSGSTKMDRNDGGSPITPTPQDPPRWKGAMGEARHADASGPTKMDRSYGESPSMSTPQDPPKWRGAMGEARHVDASRRT